GYIAVSSIPIRFWPTPQRHSHPAFHFLWAPVAAQMRPIWRGPSQASFLPRYRRPADCCIKNLASPARPTCSASDRFPYVYLGKGMPWLGLKYLLSADYIISV